MLHTDRVEERPRIIPTVYLGTLVLAVCFQTLIFITVLKYAQALVLVGTSLVQRLPITFSRMKNINRPAKSVQIALLKDGSSAPACGKLGRRLSGCWYRA